MVIMENYSSDKLQELWKRINDIHWYYLEMDESPEKIDQRLKLEDCIKEFLCIASHNQKFFLRETAEVLHRSANSKNDFSGYKAATGFNAIQLYAGNLLSQPWRKEYRQIKTYCGFYKHQIEANLVGAELLFEAMGYKHDRGGVLVLDGPICPDTVASISKDCLIAYVECQILKTIWEEVSSLGVGWRDILEFRKTHLCSLEQAIRSLKYNQHKRQYQQEHMRSYSQGNDFIATRNQPVMQPPTIPPNSFPPLNAHQNVGLPPPYMYNNGCCPNIPYSSTQYCSGYPQIIKPQFNSNGYYYMNGYGSNPPYYPVPTGQLIELENQTYDEVDKPSNSKYRLEMESRKNNNDKSDESKFEDWSYVYRDLESQGYSKDLGERGDLLSPQQERNRKVKLTNLDEAMNNLTLTPEHDKRNQLEARVEQASQGSSYENVHDVKKISKKSSSMPKITKSLPKEKATYSQVELKSKTLEVKKEADNKWQCHACTYLNDMNKSICEMCSKTRSWASGGNEMEVGGPECSNCTLVNPKEKKICQACGASLKNSPTYI